MARKSIRRPARKSIRKSIRRSIRRLSRSRRSIRRNSSRRSGGGRKTRSGGGRKTRSIRRQQGGRLCNPHDDNPCGEGFSCVQGAYKFVCERDWD